MGYIIKNTSGLVNTRLTDTARKKISEGNFNISYFQIGDSEVSYTALPFTYNQANTFILEPDFCAQNSTGAPNSNKENIKYPFYVDGFTGNTYGIPFMASISEPVYNRAVMRGFFSGNTTAETINWSALTNNNYVVNSNYVVNMSSLSGGTTIQLEYNGCNPNPLRGPVAGDFITIYYDGKGMINCGCENLPTPTPTPSNTPTMSVSATVSPTPTPSSTDPCASPTPTPTPSATYCPTPTPTKQCPPPLPPDCSVEINSCFPMMTYRIVSVCQNELTLDRATPDYTYLTSSCYARTLIYPPAMVPVYDSATPRQHWSDSVIDFESVCYLDESDVKIWNMNIPWSENPAGLNSAINKGYDEFGSTGYLGSKEYFGYASSSGQTDSDAVYYYNSFGDKIIVEPKDQKTIAIIHYTNQTIDFFYGEKFALEPFDPANPEDTTGQARNFKLHIPWVMWHKNPNCCNGETFWVDPAGFDELNLFEVHYLTSNKNPDMNNPGIRYYHLWDTNPNLDGYPNRVGKVFPDSKIVIIDDEELIAAMSYKSNRNWTLPTPRISFITPNTCGDDGSSTVGILTADTEYLYVTYRLGNSTYFTDSLHCNQYSVIQGPTSCTALASQNVAVRFGGEFGCLNQPTAPSTTTTTTSFTTTTTTVCPIFCDLPTGFFADKFEIICQKVSGTGRPEPTEWKVIDFTNQLSGSTVNGYITQDGLTGNTFVITQGLYDDAPTYNLNDYIQLTPAGFSGTQLNFGDEFYFYGALETDIQATIYEMRYKVNLGQSEFQASSNPTWNSRIAPYVSEIGLYDSEKNLMIISKLQSPVLRQGIQQFLIKFDI
jgi:hypothetical protein